MVKRRPTQISLALKTLSNQVNSDVINPQIKSNLTIKVANTLEEREEVFKLTYKIYRQKGFAKEREDERLIFPYDTHPETVILVVKDENDLIVGSTTLVFNKNGQIPAEKMYKQEINALKKDEKYSTEFCRLVVHPEYRNAKDILLLLFNYAAIYIYHVKQYSCITIEVNPKHKAYYKRLLSFDEIGTEKECPHVENAPSVLLCLSREHYLNEIARARKAQIANTAERSLYSYFLKAEQEPLVAQYLLNQVHEMTMEEKIYFGLSESGFTKAVSV